MGRPLENQEESCMKKNRVQRLQKCHATRVFSCGCKQDESIAGKNVMSNCGLDYLHKYDT
nr:hypothetical protein [Tanacetum cinerariifolium]